MSAFFRPLEILARDPNRPTGIICAGSLGVLRPPFRASIGKGEALILDVAELTDPDRVVLVTNMPSEWLPDTGRDTTSGKRVLDSLTSPKAWGIQLFGRVRRRWTRDRMSAAIVSIELLLTGVCNTKTTKRE